MACVTIGISAYDMAAPDLIDLAVAADEAGFYALWLGEHIVLPMGYGTEHPTTGTAGHHHIRGAIIKPETELVDPWTALGAVAGATRRLRLATGMYLLPLRHPLITARAALTLQEASRGRFMLGIGSGWLVEEFAALYVPFEERYGRTREAIEIVRTAWAGGPFDYHGKYFDFDLLQLSTRAIDVPLILGGNTPRSLARAATVGNGWFSSGTPSFDDVRRWRDELLRIRAENGLEEDFRCYVRIEANDPALVERYRTEGIDDVVIWADHVWRAGGDLESRRAGLFESAARLGLR
jgi:probable F420-dependent oxidoreductase